MTKLTNVVELAKRNVNSFKAGIEMGKRGMHLMFPIRTVEGIKVYVDDVLVTVHSGCMHGEPMAIATMMLDGSKGIIVNEAFTEYLEEDDQMAILYHELGHIVLGHIDTLNSMSFFKRLKWQRANNNRIEQEADQYARDHGHDIEQALRVIACGKQLILDALKKQGRV